MVLHCDVLVIGTGIAGLSYALKINELNPKLKILIVTKNEDFENNSRHAQGGIAVVTDSQKDSFDKHINDTLIAGDGLCDPSIVEIVVKEAPERVRDLMQWGTDFDFENDELDLHLEGGHSEKRIVHHKDSTGKEVIRALLTTIKTRKNIEILTHHYAIDIITEHHLKQKKNPQDITCYGAYVLDIKNGQVKTIISSISLLATGGLGHIYQNTTNPSIATGDGIGIAYRAKAQISQMSFVQFHPTAMYAPAKDGRLYLISEAVRGYGAKLSNISGEEFMHKYDKRADLAPRDIVARAIDYEMKKRGEDYVLLKIDSKFINDFKEKFPNIHRRADMFDFDISKEGIPVVPAVHYSCGGIKVNENGQTSIHRLFAVGECSGTGLHGANRLASNSLLEALVFAHRSALTSIEMLNTLPPNNEQQINIPQWNQDNTTKPEEIVMISYLKKQIRSIMSNLVGIVRSNERLESAKRSISDIHLSTLEFYKKFILSPQLLELRNMVSTAYLIIEDSKNMKENRGCFFNKDLLKNE